MLVLIMVLNVQKQQVSQVNMPNMLNNDRGKYRHLDMPFQKAFSICDEYTVHGWDGIPEC